MQRYLERRDIRVWAKLESLNPGGSAKARPAARMIADALADGRIGPGSTVIESTSGNMGVGLAQACRFHGLRLICVVDSRTTDVNLRTMRAMGADVRVVTEPDPDGGDLLGARLKLVAELVESIPGAFWPDQYSNEANAESHALGTMREIDEALDGEVDHLFVAVSTAGTLAGCMELPASGCSDRRRSSRSMRSEAPCSAARRDRGSSPDSAPASRRPCRRPSSPTA